MNILHCAIFIVLPSIIFADPIVSYPEACDLADPVEATINQGEAVMRIAGYYGIEYHCTWEPVGPFEWSQRQAVSSYGYCEEPEIINPKVFTFVTDSVAQGIINVYISETNGEPIQFFDCAAYKLE